MRTFTSFVEAKIRTIQRNGCRVVITDLTCRPPNCPMSNLQASQDVHVHLQKVSRHIAGIGLMAYRYGRDWSFMMRLSFMRRPVSVQ